MENKKYPNIIGKRGFVSEILLVLVILVFLRYFVNIDIIGYLEMPLAKVIEWLKGVIH
jgi:hypothetical protein